MCLSWLLSWQERVQVYESKRWSCISLVGCHFCWACSWFFKPREATLWWWLPEAKGEKCSDEGSRSQVVLPFENSSSIYPSSERRESHSLDGAPQFQSCELKTYQRQKKKAQSIEPTMTHQIPSQDSGTPITEIPPLSPLPSSSSDLAIALMKGKRSCTNHPISHFLSYRALPLKLLFQLFLQSENLPVLPKHCLTRSRRKLWKRKWKPCREMGLGNLFHCLKGKAYLWWGGCRWVYTVKAWWVHRKIVGPVSSKGVHPLTRRAYGVDYE